MASGRECPVRHSFWSTYFADSENILDERDSADVIYLDCRKAFDTVPHNRLLTKLGGAGIMGEVGRWISAFLENQEQRTLINGTCSSWRRVWSGVLQGSVLRPTFFLIYIYDLLDELQSEGKLFADDGKVYRRIQII